MLIRTLLMNLMSKKKKHPDINCPFCDSPAEWVSHSEIYGRIYNQAAHMIWLCRQCDAYVGCHNNTKQPLGQMANAHMRKARKLTKELFIKVCLNGQWKCDKHLKESAYCWLARELDITRHECHFGDFTVERCREAYRILQKV